MQWFTYITPTIAALTFAGSIIAVVWRLLWKTKIEIKNKITDVDLRKGLKELRDELRPQILEHASQLMVAHDGIRSLQSAVQALHVRYDKSIRVSLREKKENRERADKIFEKIESIRSETNTRLDETNKILQLLLEKHIKDG
jgi:hypothetical protein